MASVRQGRIYELGTEFGRDMPQAAPDTFYGFRLTQYRTPKSLTSRESPGFDFSMEVLTGSPHLGTHVDGLAHIQCHGRTYGGHDVRDVYGDFGWKENGMEHSRPIIGRGVLLDVATAKGLGHLPDLYAVTPKDLEETLASQGTELRPGDIVLVRTGWFAAFYRTDVEAYFRSQPGVGTEAAIWLHERGMAVLGTDTSGTEVMPMPDPERSTHVQMIVERGVHLVEIMDLEAIARDRVFEFLFIGLPLRITGGTGSWTRPVALI
ncbi:MAG: cyclase family protein [Candidatus Limnocylindrales bacterium]